MRRYNYYNQPIIEINRNLANRKSTESFTKFSEEIVSLEFLYSDRRYYVSYHYFMLNIIPSSLLSSFTTTSAWGPAHWIKSQYYVNTVALCIGDVHTA